MNLKKILLLTLLIYWLIPCVFPQKKEKQQRQVKEFVTANQVYEPTIKTVLLFPNAGDSLDYLQPAVTDLAQETPLLLSFDDLRVDMQQYYAKIIHCNADWTPSTLLSVQYLYDFNEFFITNRQTSVNPKIPYVHYEYEIPKVKISGNYLIKVYRNYDENDLILTKRFMVYENLIDISPKVGYTKLVEERDQDQQVNFTITFPDYELINPTTTLKTVIRQNYRFDNAIYNLPPRFFDEIENTLDFNYFNLENAFKGGNEFRAFDISSFYTAKLNIGKILTYPDYTEILLVEDKDISLQSYNTFSDIDGKYYIRQYETGDHKIIPDYGYVNFVLDIPEQDGEIFVIGAMNDWRRDPDFKMTFNKDLKKYVCRVLLKQGYYNYRYVLVNSDYPKGNDNAFCGSHMETQNIYEIMTYYRPPGKRSEFLIGYELVNFQDRR